MMTGCCLVAHVHTHTPLRSISWSDLRLSPEIICYKMLSQVWPSMSAPSLAASLSWDSDTDLQDSKSKLSRISSEFKLPFTKPIYKVLYRGHEPEFPKKIPEKNTCLITVPCPGLMFSHVKWCTGAINSKVNFII